MATANSYLMDIAKFLRDNGVEYFKAFQIETAFRKKYGDKLYVLADEKWVIDHVSDVVNFDVVGRTWNDSEYGEMPTWVKPYGKLDFIERSDYTGWKQCEWRGKFIFNGKVVDGTLINHFHVDRQNDGTPIENIFWSNNA